MSTSAAALPTEQPPATPTLNPPAAAPDYAALLAEGEALAQQPAQHALAVEKLLAVFRSGPPELRKQALNALSALGEVETF